MTDSLQSSQQSTSHTRPGFPKAKAEPSSLNPSSKKFLALKSAAVWADASTRTIKRWIAKGLPYYHAGPGTKILIRPSDIENFLTRQQHQTPSLDALVNETLAELGAKQRQKGVKAQANGGNSHGEKSNGD